VLFEDILAEIGNRSTGAVEIVGDRGSGKTTALAHLAAIAPRDRALAFLDDAITESIVDAAHCTVVFFTSVHPRSVRDALSYRLARWTLDDIAEYLLATHPAQCRSVMTRLRGADDLHLLEGLPELSRIVLDGMANDDTLQTVSEALWHGVQRRLKTAENRAKAELYCLDVLIAGYCLDAKTAAARPVTDWRKSPTLIGIDASIHRILQHDAVQIILAAGCLAELLEGTEGRKWLERPLPYALVKRTAAVLSSKALHNLTDWYENPQGAHHAMAASILFAADARWSPSHRPLLDLRGAHFGGARWKRIDLSGANLSCADFDDGDLRGTILRSAIALETRFGRAMLQDASLIEIEATGADFDSATLRGADVSSAKLDRAIFSGADLRGANFTRATLHEATLTDAVFRDADLTRAILVRAKIDGADFSSANLSGSWLNRLDLHKGNFAGARFASAHLQECVMEGMELPGADFFDADLRGALLTGSRMADANFYGARLAGAGLADIAWERADLRYADLTKCTFHLGSSRSGLVGSPIACEGSRTGFYGDDFDDQTFREPEEIRKANLCGADLRDAKIEGTDFYLVDLRGAKYSSAQFQYLRQCGAILFDRD
jgi:uncharacterized protein YjbI with pentapeptide repeats